MFLEHLQQFPKGNRNVTNIVINGAVALVCCYQKGHHASVYGRIDVDDLNMRFCREKLSFEDITEKVIMIRINQLYHYGMTDFELYEATRSCWRIGKSRAEKAEYVFPLYDGMIIEAYKVTAWLPACSTMQAFRKSEDIQEKDKLRIEFVGIKADESIRKKYVGKIVKDEFVKGNQNPIKYVNI